MAGKKLCPLRAIAYPAQVSCVDERCAWWSGDRCAVLPPPMEVLTVEEAKTTSVYVSVDGPDKENVVQALVAALGGKL